MSYFSKRALRWAAPVALVGALGLAACGDDDSGEAVRTNARPVAQASGLDNHLDIRAVELAQQERAYRAAAASVGLDNHLDIRAAEIASQRANRAASARLAERFESSAHLEGQANTYSGTDVPTNSDANLPNAFEAGNRAVQMTQAPAYVWQQQHRAESSSSDASYRAAQAAEADAYVEQQQDRAESSSYEGEFLPGGHHVPSR
jgi:predicted outer membrane protein